MWSFILSREVGAAESAGSIVFQTSASCGDEGKMHVLSCKTFDAILRGKKTPDVKTPPESIHRDES